MARTKKKVQRYDVLVACSNDITGKWYRPGAVIKDGDFPAAVIENWLELDPPVLKKVGADNGSD